MKRFCMDTEDGYFGQEEDFANGIFMVGSWDNDEIIQQYTGLKDRNGKEIYEGDIVTTIYDLAVGEVRHYVETASYRIFTKTNLYPLVTVRVVEGSSEFRLVNVYDEVVGNVCENPELL
jgi:uncharacterized phage protein (TIGR01671 family)